MNAQRCNDLRLTGSGGANRVMEAELKRLVMRSPFDVRLDKPTREGDETLLYAFDARVAWVAAGVMVGVAAVDVGRFAQGLHQLVAAGHGAGQAVADADCHRRRGGLAIAHQVELRVERGDFENLGLRHAQFRGEGRKVPRRKVAMAILDQMEIFDQQIALARQIAKKGLDLLNSSRLDLASLGNCPGSPSA